MISIDGLNVKLGERIVVRGASLKVQPGVVVALVGANGSGKSTILRAVSHEIRALSGEIRMAGRLLSAWSPAEAARVRAVLPQLSTLSFPFTAFDVVMLGRIPHAGRASKLVDHRIAAAALDAVDGEELASRRYPSLSGGERQRVQLARVLAQVWPANGAEDRYLLLDEPTNNLDVRHQHLVLRIARQAAAAGMGVLAVLHDLNLAAQYADTVVVLRRGEVVTSGSPAAALTRETIQHAFGIPATVVDHPLYPGPMILTSIVPDAPSLRTELN